MALDPKQEAIRSDIAAAKAGKAEYPEAALVERAVEAVLEKLLPGVLDRVLPKKLEGPAYNIDVLNSVYNDTGHMIQFRITNNSRSGLYIETLELIRPEDEKATVRFQRTGTEFGTFGDHPEVTILLEKFPAVFLAQDHWFQFHLAFSKKDANKLSNEPYGTLRFRLSHLNEKKSVPIEVPFIIRWRAGTIKVLTEGA